MFIGSPKNRLFTKRRRPDIVNLDIGRKDRMDREKRIREDRNLLEIVQGLLYCIVSFQEIFKKYREGRLRFLDIEAWVDDKGKSPLYNLKEQSHSFFRNRGKESIRKKEWLLDLLIGSIFHEAMKLRENVYQLECYRPRYLRYRRDIGKTAYEKNYSQQFERIFSKAGQGVLQGMSEIQSLFQDVMEQLVGLFKENSRNPYLIRFLLEHQPMLKKVYGSKMGKEWFDLIFENGLQEAYDRAGRSYLLSGHYDLASFHFSKALTSGPPHNELTFLHYFSLGMEAYYENTYAKALSFWENLLHLRLKRKFRRHYFRLLEEACHKMASELKEEGKIRLAQRVGHLADQIKKMLK